MEFYDPQLRGLTLLLDDFSGAIDWLSDKATGHHTAPFLHKVDVWHIKDIADSIDRTFGHWALIQSSAQR